MYITKGAGDRTCPYKVPQGTYVHELDDGLPLRDGVFELCGGGLRDQLKHLMACLGLRTRKEHQEGCSTWGHLAWDCTHSWWIMALCTWWLAWDDHGLMHLVVSWECAHKHWIVVQVLAA